MKIHNSFRDRVISDVIALVDENEEEVESGHDGGSHVDVLLQRLSTIVASSNRIGCRQNRRASV